MNKTTFLLLFLVSSIAVFSQDRILDFRDITFGHRIDSIYRNGTKLEFSKDRNSTLKNSYFLINDNMYLGSVKLNVLNYVFNNDLRFYKVFIQGNKEDISQMRFILTYKFGEFRNESMVDGIRYQQWIIKDVTFTLAEYDNLKFELIIESNWQASETYKKNTNVDDF